jgi:Cu2+-containing amine oxidase
MIDGLQNQVVQVDIDVDEAPVGSESNFYGNGFRTFKKVYETAKGAVADYDASKCRSWVIENPNKQHYCTGGNVGYKLSESMSHRAARVPLRSTSVERYASNACQAWIAGVQSGAICPT